MSKKLSKTYKDCFEIQKLTKDLVHLKEINRVQSTEDWIQCAIFTLSAMAVKRYHAILNLCYSKFYEDAQLLVRSLYDLVVKSCYILQDKSGLRAKTYFAQELTDQIKILKSMRDDSEKLPGYEPIKNIGKDKLDSFIEQWLSQKQDLTKENKDLETNKFSNLKDLAFKLDKDNFLKGKVREKYPFTTWYNLAYRMISGIEHNQIAFNFHNYTLQKDSGNTALICENVLDEEKAMAVLSTSSKLYLILFNEIFEKMSLTPPKNWSKYNYLLKQP